MGRTYSGYAALIFFPSLFSSPLYLFVLFVCLFVYFYAESQVFLNQKACSSLFQMPRFHAINGAMSDRFSIMSDQNGNLVWHVLPRRNMYLRTSLSVNWLEFSGSTRQYLGLVLLGPFRNRNSWNDQNNPSFLCLSWLQTCQNQITVSLWRFYSHSGIRVARQRTIVWLIPTIPIPE